MGERVRYRRGGENHRDEEIEERQARLLTAQILAVLLLLVSVWGLGFFSKERQRQVTETALLALNGGYRGAFSFDYDRLESFFAGNFSLPSMERLEAVLGRLTWRDPQDAELFPEVQAVGGRAVLPGGVSFSPILLSAPFGAPVSGTVTSNFGWREDPFGGTGTDFHTGFDIAAPQGSPVFAVLPGVVVDTGTSSALGNYIYLQHGENLTTLYAHCSHVIARPGERLRQGERIALVGSTGNSTGAHLHLELISGGVSYSPAPFLPLVEEAAL